MKKLEELVPSLETCKKLKEAGFEQDTFCFYRKSPIGEWKLTTLTSYPFTNDCISAPTLGEIELPEDYYIIKANPFYYGCISDYSPGSDHNYLTGFCKSEIEARAELWLYLKEHEKNK